MSAKQDRQGVRKPSDIERKYNLGQDYADIVAMAVNAQKSAETASKLASMAYGEASGKAPLEHEHSADDITGILKVFTGTYTGNGAFGVDNPNTLTFEFEPKLLIITAYTDCFGDYPWVHGSPKGRTYSKESAVNYAELTWSETSVSWYSTDAADKQLNTDGYVYYYIAIG